MPVPKIHPENENKIHFLTFTTIEWIDIFTKPPYFQLLLNSMEYCRNNLGLMVYGYVFMTNHIHVIWQAKIGYQLSQIVLSYKRFTTEKIEALIKEDNRKHIAGLIGTSFFKKPGNRFQVWRDYNYPEVIETDIFLQEKLNYIHNNPAKKRYVEKPENWLYSSAKFYVSGDCSLFMIDKIK